MVANVKMRPADFRQMIIERLESLGWNKAKLARHNKVTMHPTSVFRYLRGDRSTDADHVAELLQILGWESDRGFVNGAVEPTSMRMLSDPEVKVRVRRKRETVMGKAVIMAATKVQHSEAVTTAREWYSTGNTLSSICEMLNGKGWKTATGKVWNRGRLWAVVKDLKRS